MGDAFNWRELKDKYWRGLGFRRNDILEPLEPLRGTARGAIEAGWCGESRQCLVIEQSALCPHHYTVIATRDGGDNFSKFEINGHDWKVVGHA